MRKVLFLLTAAWLLCSCNEVADFGRMLPENVLLDEVVSVSDLTCEQLDEMVPDVAQRDELRRYGGLLVRVSSGALSGNQNYDFREIYYSDSQSNLPPYDYSGGGIPSSPFTNSFYVEDRGTEWQPLIWWDDSQILQLPGKTIYFKAVFGLSGYWDEPGFVDDCLGSGYETRYIYSDVQSYTYPSAPLITEFMVEGSDMLHASFRICTEGELSSVITRHGICISSTHALPDVNDRTFTLSNDNPYGQYAEVVASVSGGTYYVRAFAEGVDGDISYSPVQQVTCQGLVAETRIDTLISISEMGYHELERSLPEGIDPFYYESFRRNGGFVAFVSAHVEGDYIYPDMRLAVIDGSGDFQDDSSIPYTSFGYYEELGNGDYRTGYWVTSNSFTAPGTYYMRSEVELLGSSGHSIWNYSDIHTYTVETYPRIDIFEVSYYDGRLSATIECNTWGALTEVGLCYSRTSDLPTLENCEGFVISPQTSADYEDGFFPGSIYEEIALQGEYYVRGFARSTNGIAYSPVVLITTE